MDGNGSGSCPVAELGISGVETSGFAAKVVNCECGRVRKEKKDGDLFQ